MDKDLDNMAELISGLEPEENARLVSSIAEISIEMEKRGLSASFNDMLALATARHAVVHGDKIDVEDAAFHLSEKVKKHNDKINDDKQKELSDYVTPAMAMADNRPPVPEIRQIELPALTQDQIDSLNTYELIEYSRGHILETVEQKLNGKNN